MIKIKAYSLADFIDKYLPAQQAARGIRATVLHHTYRPRAEDYRGITTIENIRSYHVHSRGWRDIGANAYAAPDGKVYNGRPLNWSNYANAYISKSWSDLPADLKKLAYPDRQFLNRRAFGIETIGDFDAEDPATSVAMKTSLDILAAAHRIWKVPVKHCFFHRDVAHKSCPGNKVGKAWVHEELRRRLEGETELTPVMIILHGSSPPTVLATAYMVANGNHVAKQGKLYVEALEVAEGD